MGVKSLWQLLDPVGRPVLLETMEGKAMAIDSSIWIYQFQATMRDKEGRGLVNAHVLGFLRRISKLLFYGIKPVFVFDGGAPALKRATISERKKKKSGAVMSHAKVAERLLAAQMRREALNQVKTKSGDSSKRRGKVPDGPVVVDENAVYLEDLDEPVPTTPAKKAQASATSPPSSKKKSSQMDEAIANATRSSAPDPRLATEDELRGFIEEMRPEDFDVGSPAFRELPTEVQYEIIGDMRLKSRQTSYKRLQNMLRIAKTPLDFSRSKSKSEAPNSLTQQLLTTTDSIGKAHVEIPIRIASERNREYVLVKNEGAEGGWVLGIRDEGSRSKPIEIDPVSDKENEEDDSDVEMEEVQIDSVAVDPDLREYRRNQALSALASRYSPKKLTPLTTRTQRKPKNPRPLFAPEEDELSANALAGQDADDEGDPALEAALQESLEVEEEANLRRAMEASRTEGKSLARYYDSDDEDLYASPSRLETALSIAGARPSRRPVSESRRASGSSHPHSSIFGTPSLLLPESTRAAPVPAEATPTMVPSDSDEDEMEEVLVPPPVPRTPPPRVMGLDVPRSHPVSESEDDEAVPWDRPPSLNNEPSTSGPTAVASTADGWDAADEMDPHAEEGEFARFMSQVKGKDIESVRREIDDEIRDLNQQRKAAMRDSEDITQQMISQIMIMLRLFGIPYITAPMEAEAQCAELAALGLVDGIITDDSDVFLFGGLRVLKNMFNQSKTVECFLLSDLERELGLDRDKLIRLAYLLGSDYTDGLPGVGPVDGLHKFKDWWKKVQSGKDTAEDTGTAFRKRFKKRYKELFIPDDWPNPTVRDAYYHPTVDESEEPFKWGLPDLDALRDFFNSELSWSQSKVDDLLLPIIRKMGKRGQVALELLLFHVITLLTHIPRVPPTSRATSPGFRPPGRRAAPRKRQAYASKRLQQVVSDFRKERARVQSTESSGTGTTSASGEQKLSLTMRIHRREGAGAAGAKTGRGAKSTRGGNKGKRTAKKRKASESDSESEADVPLADLRAEGGSPPPPLAVNLRPRPKPKPAYKGAIANAVPAAGGEESG
ncbi:uncharacterized protein B0H18DRAFT_1117970 [Fomitopsis serialis]|uniref:uncharacterized protein n=1 Tax=Fomitopsis serialis TaxID=139415 RepID=UPI002007BC62|nr:uncharacterized protein B0H18DRAFT_1117970 [Neoantrodia serialis]KAH9928285.1 hypothetical protein B0H18DRAFT_1117970 [Neoantrodia serialis]